MKRESRVGFTVAGFDVQPDAVTKTIGISPDAEYICPHPKGSTQHIPNRWTIFSPLGEDKSVEDRISALLDRLDPVRAKLALLPHDKYFSVVYHPEFAESGFDGSFLWASVPSTTVRRMAELNAAFSIEYFLWNAEPIAAANRSPAEGSR